MSSDEEPSAIPDEKLWRITSNDETEIKANKLAKVLYGS